MRATTISATAPPAAQAAWRTTKYQDEPNWSRAMTDEADITITRPSRLNTATRKARATNSPDDWARARGVRAVGWRRRASSTVVAGLIANKPRPPAGAGGASSRAHHPGGDRVGEEQPERHGHGHDGQDPEPDD